ncbi:hypothetical protein HQ447_10130 [bacterium]|nr:hypothetical protein [bacterium]
MPLTLKAATPRRVKNAFSPGMFSVKGILRILRLTFISGPFLLFTSRLSGKNASIMIMLCTPALLLWALLTIPPLLFTSPDQHAYFQFANVLDHDPMRLITLGLATLCSLVALAIPATSARPYTAVR